jgi:hypothetical protein
VEVGARHWVDHLSPELDTDLTVLVENIFIELVLVDADKAIVQRADISKATCETKTAAITF